ncbi:MAG: cytochrome c oxidase assembly protein [Geminicoccaceae bacterium]|nr:MAG: cytochrome c oxidase assembly protein [Geminicoccaceae bacterium]
MTAPSIAYCGLPPTPADLALAWNLDPPLLAGLALFGVLVARHAVDRTAGWSAWVLLALVFVSPLCALTAALFSARLLHHVVLVALVAPLLVRAFPLPGPWLLAAGPVFVAHWLVLWLWHVPGAYVWALDTVAGYWLMQVTLLASAVLLWRAVLLGPTGPSFGLLVGTIGQMGLLGALLVFAPEPLYLVHLATTAPWGLTPLADQQLAGVVMWVPAMLPYLAVGLARGWRALADAERVG